MKVINLAPSDNLETTVAARAGLVIYYLVTIFNESNYMSQHRSSAASIEEWRCVVQVFMKVK